MKHHIVLISSILSFALVLASCSRQDGIPASSVSNAGSNDENMITIDKELNYKKLPDINVDNIQEIKLQSEIQWNNIKTCQVEDGIIAGSMASDTVNNEESEEMTWPIIKKFNNQGELLWEKEYPLKRHMAVLNNIKSYPDGSFIFTVQTIPHVEKLIMTYEKSYIIKCDKDGNLIWKQEFDDYSGRMLDYMFLTSNDNVIILGEWSFFSGKQTQQGSHDIVITKLDKNGQIINQKSFGGSNFDNLTNAQFDNELGIVLSGTTQSSDGDFALSKDGYGVGFIACFDEELNLLWKYAGLENENIGVNPLVISKGYIYKAGFIERSKEVPSSGILLKLDAKGSRIWTKINSAQFAHLTSIAVLNDGSIAISAGKPNKGQIMILDKDGNVKESLDNIGFSADSIIPTADGGFITKASRTIRTIPSPKYISSIWYDTEIVAAKFDKNYSVEWRKTYDNYKNTNVSDFVQPLEDGKLMVEGIN